MHLCNIGRIRPNISENTAATLVHAFISSKLDNLNSLLFGISESVMIKLQTNAARIISRKRRCDHITPVLPDLHWLLIKYRIRFNICLIPFKALNGLSPARVCLIMCIQICPPTDKG